MTARIFNLDDDERFVRTPHGEGNADGDGGAHGNVEVLQRAAGFSGAISLPLLPDLIQIYTTSMADGALTIRRGTQSGTIWFERGSMVHAVCGQVIGVDAVYRLLEWHDGQFSLDKGAAAPVHSIDSSWQEVLIEGCRRLDEAAEANLNATSDGSYDAVFAEIEQALSGFLAVAVLDGGDGSVAAQRSRTPAFDFDTAGPLVAELLRAQARVMAAVGRAPAPLDSLSILGDQVHLVVSLPEGNLLYVAVSKTAANLATVRRVVDRALGRAT